MPRTGAQSKARRRSGVRMLQPMEARSVEAVPEGTQWQYEPKWDGFRCILVRDGELVTLQSKSGENLTRYFPELVRAARELKSGRYTLDGEIVVRHGRSFS